MIRTGAGGLAKPRRATAGAALLEAIVALTVLATIGGAGAWMASETLRAVDRAHSRELDQRGAARLMTAVSLWPAADLERHLGKTRQGPWDLLIDRTGQALYLVAITDRQSGAIVLRTAVHRRSWERP